MKYTLAAPKYFVGQMVEFVDRWGNVQTGEVSMVKTWYDGKLNGRHNYYVRRMGKDGWFHRNVAEEEIIGVAVKA
jgi:hypothetical protein